MKVLNIIEKETKLKEYKYRSLSSHPSAHKTPAFVTCQCWATAE